MQPPSYTGITDYLRRESDAFMNEEAYKALFCSCSTQCEGDCKSCACDHSCIFTDVMKNSARTFITRLNTRLDQVKDIISPGAYIRRYMRCHFGFTTKQSKQEYARFLTSRMRQMFYPDGIEQACANAPQSKHPILQPSSIRRQLQRLCGDRLIYLQGGTYPNREDVFHMALALDFSSQDLNTFLADYFVIGALNWRNPKEATLAFVLNNRDEPDDKQHLSERYARWQRLCKIFPTTDTPPQRDDQDVSPNARIRQLHSSINKERTCIRNLESMTNESEFIETYRSYLIQWTSVPQLENRIFEYCYHCLILDMHQTLCVEQNEYSNLPFSSINHYSKPKYIDGLPVAHKPPKDADQKNPKEYVTPYYQPTEVEHFLYPGLPFTKSEIDRKQYVLSNPLDLHDALRSQRLTAAKISDYLTGTKIPNKADIETLLFAQYHMLLSSLPDTSHPFAFSMQRITCSEFYSIVNRQLSPLGTLRPTTPYGYFLTALSLIKDESPLECFYAIYKHAYPVFIKIDEQLTKNISDFLLQYLKRDPSISDYLSSRTFAINSVPYLRTLWALKWDKSVENSPNANRRFWIHMFSRNDDGSIAHTVYTPLSFRNSKRIPFARTQLPSMSEQEARDYFCECSSSGCSQSFEWYRLADNILLKEYPHSKLPLPISLLYCQCAAKATNSPSRQPDSLER